MTNKEILIKDLQPMQHKGKCPKCGETYRLHQGPGFSQFNGCAHAFRLLQDRRLFTDSQEGAPSTHGRSHENGPQEDA